MNRRQALRAISSISAAAALPPGLLAAAGQPPAAAQGAPAVPAHKAAAGPHKAGKGAGRATRVPAPPTRRGLTAVSDHPSNFDPEATQLLEEIRDRAAQYFYEQADPATGMVYDRARADGSPTPRTVPLASIAATGFGLSALAVGGTHGYLPYDWAEQRILTTLTTVARDIPHQHGFLPHYLNAHTLEPVAPVEFSSIDTALLLAGVLHAAKVLNSRVADGLAREIYDRIEWPWMLNGGDSLAMAWEPKDGFLPARWNSYSECLTMYLMAIGSRTHPLPASAWDAVTRNTYDYGGIRFISSFGALFIHQYPHLWLDLRNVRDQYANYFQNSVAAMRAHKTWCMLQKGRFGWVDERIWGFSASDTPRETYAAWGAPPAVGDWDGTLAPHAAAGGIAMLPEECVVALKTFRSVYPRSWRRYGFVNAFHPGAGKDGWYDPDIISIDLGLSMLMIENQQSGAIWASCSKLPAIARAMKAVGFTDVSPAV